MMTKIVRHLRRRGRRSGIDLLVSSVILVLAAPAFLGGCEDRTNKPFEPLVVNVTDSFHFQANDVKNQDTTITYYWRNGGSTANIDQSASIEGGSVLVTIEDSNRKQVYQTDLSVSGSFTTESGAGDGFWRIRFDLREFTGVIDFWALRR